jgi:hypothetical protein
MEHSMPTIRETWDFPSQHIDLDVRNLQILIFREGQHLVAQCLQYDFAAQGKDFQEAAKNMVHTISTQVLLDTKDGVKPLSNIPKAPQEYWDAWVSASKVDAPCTRCDSAHGTLFADVGKLVKDSQFSLV